MGDILPSQAVPMPAEANASGRAQHAAAPKAANIPPPIAAPFHHVPMPRITVPFANFESSNYVRSVATTDSRGSA